MKERKKKMVCNNKIISKFFIATSITLLCLGCGKSPAYQQLGLANVSGTVTLDEKPLEGATVKFEDKTGRFSYGVTNSSGYYSMMFDSSQAGVSPGEKVIRISMSPLGDEAEFPEGEESEEGTQQDAPTIKIPARFNKESELSETVEENSSHTFDFDLHSE